MTPALLPLLLQAAAVSAAAPEPVLEPIGRQALPVRGCAAYLWDNAPKRRLVAMATAEPGLIRLRIDGRPVDLTRVGAQGAAGFGFGAVTEYRGADVLAVLDMAAETRRDLTGGAVVREASLRVERPGRDALVLPVAGLIGCAAAT